MSHKPLLLEGRIEPDEVGILRHKIERLESDLENTRLELRHAKADNASISRGLIALRHQVEPWYRALAMMMGELESVNASEPTPPSNPRIAQVWESWKQKLGGKQAAFIQALLEHGEMTAVQLKVATHTGTSTVPQVIYKLNQLSLINKRDGKYSLKEL